MCYDYIYCLNMYSQNLFVRTRKMTAKDYFEI